MVIFLDIDGVMVPAAGWKTPELMDDGFVMFSQKATKALNSLLTPETSVILSSSHRDRFSIDEWKRIFGKRGLHIENLERLGPVRTPSKRKDEIEQWFNTHAAPGNFVIIDDDTSLYALPEHLKRRLIVTNSLIGLTPEQLQDVAA